ATEAGARFISLLRRVLPRDQSRSAIRIDALRPTHLRVRLRRQHLAIRTIERIEKTVPVCLNYRLDKAAVDIQVYQNGIADGVPIVHIVRSELEMPLQLTGIGIEGHEAAGIKVISGAHIAVHVRSGIACAPVSEVEFGIIGAGDPRGAASARR